MMASAAAASSLAITTAADAQAGGNDNENWDVPLDYVLEGLLSLRSPAMPSSSSSSTTSMIFL